MLSLVSMIWTALSLMYALISTSSFSLMIMVCFFLPNYLTDQGHRWRALSIAYLLHILIEDGSAWGMRFDLYDKSPERSRMPRRSQQEEPVLNQEMLTRLLRDKNHLLWNDQLTQPVITKWLQNFNGKVFSSKTEQLMAQYILSRFVLLTYEEVKHLCIIMCRQYALRQIQETKAGSSRNVEAVYQKMIDRTRFLPVERPSKSGHLVAYYLRTENNIPPENFVSLKEANQEKSDFLCLVDDVSLTGQEASAFLTKLKKGKHSSYFLLVMIATSEAVNLLAHHNVKVVAPIVLHTDELKLGSRSTVMMDFDDEVGVVFSKLDLERFLRTYGEQVLPGDPLGYGGLALLFGFAYNVPDNTLPIVWQKVDWSPIFERRAPAEKVSIDASHIFV